MDLQSQLSRRERQITDIIFARGEVSSADILEYLPDPPARGALRVMLRILEDKGHIKHHKKGRKFIYRTMQSRQLNWASMGLMSVAASKLSQAKKTTRK